MPVGQAVKWCVPCNSEADAVEAVAHACRIAASDNCAVVVSTGGIQLDMLEGLRAEAEAGVPSASVAVGDAPMAMEAGAAGGLEEGGGEMMHADQDDAVMSGAQGAQVCCLLLVHALFVFRGACAREEQNISPSDCSACARCCC